MDPHSPQGVQFQLNVPQGYSLTLQQVKVRLAWSARLVAGEGTQLPGEPEPVGEVKCNGERYRAWGILPLSGPGLLHDKQRRRVPETENNRSALSQVCTFTWAGRVLVCLASIHPTIHHLSDTGDLPHSTATGTLRTLWDCKLHEA